MPWTPYNAGSGPVAPYFPGMARWVASIPDTGKGNIYTPNTPKGAGYRRNQVIRPGMEGGTLVGLVGRRRGTSAMKTGRPSSVSNINRRPTGQGGRGLRFG